MTARADELRSNVVAVRARVAEACDRAGRSDRPTIIAVSKTHSPEDAQVVVDAGLVDLGENRVQELVAKHDLVTGARFHLIGPLQSNKVADVVGRASMVHTVGRAKLAERLDRLAARTGATVPVLVQVNVGDDPAKSGCTVAEAPALIAQIAGHPHLELRGLMTIPPLPAPGDDANVVARPHFSRLRELRDHLQPEHPELVELSMGMSADLEAAVAEGATLVRVGTAVFGTRGDAPWAATNRIPA